MRREVWSVLLPLLGVNLWALVCLLPLQLEWLVEDTRGLVMVAYLLPLVFLAAGMALRWSGMLVLLFPSSFVPIYLVLPQADQAVHEGASGWLSLAASMVMYVCVAAAWLGRREPRALWGGARSGPQRRDGRELVCEPSPVPPLRYHLWWPYKVHFPARWVFLLLLGVVPLYGVNFSEGVSDRYVSGFGAQADQAQVMATLIFLFTWMVVAYLFFFSPGLHLELEQRELDVALQRYEDRAVRGPAARRYALLGAGGLALLGLLLLWQLR